MSKLRAFTMPKWGIEMLEGTISEWSIAEGDAVTKGQTVAQIETDKIVNELVVEYDATVVRLTAEVGETYPVGALLGVMAVGEASKEAVDAFVREFQAGRGADLAAPGREASSSEAAVARAATATAAAAAGTATRQPPLADARRISPGAHKLAARLGLDISQLKGSGRAGRITLQDVDQASKAARQIVRMTPTRRAIARQLTHAKATIPHFYLRADVKLDGLLAARTERKKRDGSAPSINDYLIKASALALIEVPDVNIQVHGEEIHRFHEANVAVAVATERGLMTPVLRSADSKPLAQLSQELRILIDSARAGKLSREDIQGGSFTVSNLGMYGIEQFDAIINPPQGAILSIGATRRLAMESGGTIVFSSVACLSLSCDHRAIDGAVGARFLAALKKHTESPESL